ncbi:MAG TPA: hypothetical protein VG142_11870 [Trebonia sp.]|jgi:hypothetical protein|nr:hypothetical protein [Trebonia sp.]
MSDVSLEVLNRRTAIAAVHAEASRIGVDGEQLLDSSAFYNQVASLDPDAPGFRTQVREMVSAAAGTVPSGTQTPQPDPGQPRHWTLDDVRNATPAETVAAGEAGLLRDLGYAPRRKRRGR